MSDKSTLAVVIASWNGGAQTDRCLRSVRNQEIGSCRVFLVDNASEPQERERLQTAYGNDPDVDLVDLPGNRGYAGGNDVGIERALHAGAEHVLVLTQDAALEGGALRHLLDTAASHPRAGIIGPRVVDSRTGVELSRGERFVVPLLCAPRTLLRHRARRTGAYPVSGVLGCAMLLTRVCLESVGGFDEEFFAYYEEVDLCLRAHRAGFDVLCVPEAVVSHDGMRGFAGGFTVLSAELKSRNLLYLARKHGGPMGRLLFWPLYTALIAASMGWYAARSRPDIVRALGRGVREGFAGRTGRPPSLARAW
jgi:GT2 family glycosyltransferase